MTAELTPSQLRRSCDPTSFGIDTTADATGADGIIGQPRATDALRFGLGMRNHGYHVFVAGPSGTGKMTAVNSYLAESARHRPTPDDLCYVFNFSDPERPRALQLPAGRGRQLGRDLDHALQVAQQQLPQAFDSDEYTSRRDELMKALEDQRERRLNELSEHSRAQGFLLQATPMGLLLVPLHNGQPMKEEDFAKLGARDQEEWQRRRSALQEEIAVVMKDLRHLERQTRERLEQIDREVALYTVGGLLEDLTEHYAGLPGVSEYLAALREDLVRQVGLFRASPDGPPEQNGMGAFQREQALRRYRVNVVVQHEPTDGAPVVVETHPTYQNLVGRIEKEAQFGVLTTDFTLIRGGALQRANGGFLVIQAEDLLRQPLAWDGLKRALGNREVSIEDPSDLLGITSVRTLRPEPVPLDLKVVIVGEPSTYYLVHQLDPDFRELFRVRADFDVRMPRTSENEGEFVRFVCRMCQEEKLRPFDRTALASIVEHASRLVEDQSKLSIEFGAIAELVREADFWAGKDEKSTVTGTHVQQALDRHVYRSSMVEEYIQEAIARGTLIMDVTGSVVGQVNGLAVHQMADYSFGRPSRITAAVGVGRDGVLDVEREAKLGGRLHSKGILILSGFLMDRFARTRPLTLSARLAFEQSYEDVDGDSASSAELYALLSRLADTPIKQSLAVTGSVNQRGEVQAIGGVNQKIEGFFATCRAKGLTGEQGVLIPASNVPHLMLRGEVVDAVREGRFHVYPIASIDEGIEVLTGVPAGAPDSDGRFPPDSISGRIESRLATMAEALRSTSSPPSDGIDKHLNGGQAADKAAPPDNGGETPG